ncbi:hypothetical protein [uncultured Albimonas sp.]|uniref:hypothetical protein n=1 Tax=uncultured Albimonas sp. TaxID=1331701 RepID=UPI0030EF062F
MIRWLQRLGRRHPLALVLLAAVLLSLRMTGGALAGPAVAGYVPICTGAEIVYIAVGGDGLPLDQTAPDPKVCDFAGLVSALTPEAPVAPPPPEAPGLARAVLVVLPHLPPLPRSFDTRAPPRLG